MNDLPNLERELSAPPFVFGPSGIPQRLPEVRSYGVIPDHHGKMINFAEIEADHMPESQSVIRVGDWVYVSEDITSKTKGGQSPQSEAVRDFVAQEEGKTRTGPGRLSLRVGVGQLAVHELPESYLPSPQPANQA